MASYSNLKQVIVLVIVECDDWVGELTVMPFAIFVSSNNYDLSF